MQCAAAVVADRIDAFVWSIATGVLERWLACAVARSAAAKVKLKAWEQSLRRPALSLRVRREGVIDGCRASAREA